MIERMVLFGASGDLTSRLLMPAVAQLAEASLLPPGFTVLGWANTDWSTDDFRQHIASELEKHAPVTPATRDAVIRMLSFQAADVTRPEDVSQLIGSDRPGTLVYLRSMAHHRPCHERMVSRRRPHAGVPGWPGATRPAPLTHGPVPTAGGSAH